MNHRTEKTQHDQFTTSPSMSRIKKADQWIEVQFSKKNTSEHLLDIEDVRSVLLEKAIQLAETNKLNIIKIGKT